MWIIQVDNHSTLRSSSSETSELVRRFHLSLSAYLAVEAVSIVELRSGAPSLTDIHCKISAVTRGLTSGPAMLKYR